jgi:transketolase
MRTYAELPGLMTLMTGDEKHDASATSTLDVLWVLYDQVLRVTPGSLDDPRRDRFLLSKGHGPAAYYAVLAAKEFIPESWLPGFGSASSPLGYHPDRALVPGVEIASGSLGHGLPIGVGVAHGLLAQCSPAQCLPAQRSPEQCSPEQCSPEQRSPEQGLSGPRVYVLVGDAELDEGSNSEAIVYAGAAGLPNLTVVAVDNRSSSWGWGAGGIEAHFAVAGWSVTRVSGRDHDALAAAFQVTSAASGGPQLVVATVEGKESGS